MFLKIDSIKGESLDAKHPDEIPVVSYSWGTSNSGTIAPRRRGVPHADELTVAVYTSKASLPLFLACAQGTMLGKATLTVRKTGDLPVEYLKIDLEKILVSSEHQSSGGDLVTESFSFRFGRMKLTYTGQNQKGELLDPITAAFDFVGKKVV
jgi:type VI secretion system secreted protein Hcp